MPDRRPTTAIPDGGTGAHGDGDFDPLAEAERQFLAHGLGSARRMHAAVSLIHAHQVVANGIDRVLKPLGLTFARYEVLMLLSFSRAGSLPVTKIGERLLVHPTGVTRLVDKLMREGLVERQEHPDDRRSVLVTVTDDGRALGRRASDLLAEADFGVHVDDAELGGLIECLDRVRDADR